MNDERARPRDFGGAENAEQVRTPTPVFVTTAARRFWYILLATTVAAAIVGGIYGGSRPKVYEATASIYFSNTSVTDRATGDGGFNSDPDREAATRIALIEVPAVATRAAQMLGAGWTTSKVRAAFEVEAGGQSDLVTVTATAAKPGDAARVADAVTNAAIAYRNEAARRDSVEALALINNQLRKMSSAERASATGVALEADQSRLELEVARPGGDAKIAERAHVPTSPSTPPAWRLGVLGGLFGLALGLGAAVLRHRLDPRISTHDQLRQIWPSATVLATLPEDNLLAAGAFENGASPSLAPLLIARTSVRYLTPGSAAKVIGITSAIAGEGKSTIAWGLAAAATAEGDRVLIIETDLRAPSLGTTRKLPSSPGTLGYLQGSASLSEIIRHGGTGALPFDVIPAGGVEAAPVPLLRGDRFRALVAEASAQYDFVIVDLPPVTLVPDALSVAPELDAHVVVVRMGYETPSQLIRARSLLSELETENRPALGLIVNRGRGQVARAYGAGVGYGPSARTA